MEKIFFNINPDDNPVLGQYYNSLVDCTGLMQATPKFDSLRDKRDEAFKQLSQSLTPEQIKLLGIYDDAESDVDCYCYHQLYLLGFKSAMHIAKECSK